MPAGSAFDSATDEIDLTEDTACETCRKTDDADDMLVCARCDRGYHSQCLSPRLSTAPKGDWLCTSCHGSKLQASLEAKAKTPILTDEGDTDAEDLQHLTTSIQEATTLSKPQHTAVHVLQHWDRQASGFAVPMCALLFHIRVL